MSDMDRFIWECSDEKIIRIVNALAKQNVKTSHAAEIINVWRERGWKGVAPSYQRLVLKAVASL